MKYSSLLLLLFFCMKAIAFDQDFKVINDRAPLEFEMMFESLKNSVTSPSEQLELIAVCKDLNENLKHLDKANIFLLLKTEVIKGTLEQRFTNKRYLDINENLILKLKTAMAEKKDKLSSFSRWIAQSMISELEYRKDLGLITATPFDHNLFPPAKKPEALRFKNYLTYISPWIDKFLSIGPIGFNNFTKEVAKDLLSRINSRTLLFKRFAKTSSTNTEAAVFNIPQKYMELAVEEIKRMQNDLPLELSFKEKARKEKLEAAKQIEKVTPLDMSTLSEDVARELEAQEKKDAPSAP